MLFRQTTRKLRQNIVFNHIKLKTITVQSRPHANTFIYSPQNNVNAINNA